MILFYEEYFNGVDGKIKAMRLDTDGNYLWTPNYIDMCTVQSEKVHTEVSKMNNGQWIAVWEDSRNGGKDIYGQNIKLDGTLGPVSLVPEIEIIPDTLYIDYNATIYYIYIHNISMVDYVIDTLYEDGFWVDLSNLPEFPYILEPDDSLTIEIPVFITGNGGTGNGYVYYTFFVESDFETKTSVIAFNLDVIPGISGSLQPEGLKIYPNPFNARLCIEFNCDNESIAELTILNSQGNIVMSTGSFNCNAGKNSYQWDGKTNSGVDVPAGVYSYRLKLNDRIMSGRIVKTQ